MVHGSKPSNCQDLLIQIGGKVFLCRQAEGAVMTNQPSANKREERVVMDAGDISRAMTRIAHEILERNKGVKDLAFVGIRTGGVHLAHRLVAASKISKAVKFPSVNWISRYIATICRCEKINRSSGERRCRSRCRIKSSYSSTTCSSPEGRYARRWMG